MGFTYVSRARVKCHVFVDFDGTIVPRDATDFLFEQFADPSWQAIERDWQEGRIGSRECMTRQVALLRATPYALKRAIGVLAIDRGFSHFVRQCRQAGIGMTILSDGFDLVIEQVLGKFALDLPFYANHLQSHGADRWRVTFPSGRSDCRALAGNCKCSFTEPHSGCVKVVIGDGRSDFCLSGRADLIFAKAQLAALCGRHGVSHFTFGDFFDVSERLAAWLALERGLGAGEAWAGGGVGS